MSEAKQETACCNCSLAYANLLLRLWIGLRLFMAGVDKFRAGNGAGTTFNMDNFQKKTDQIASLMSNNSFLPAWSCNLYAKGVGFALLAVGIWVAVGVYTELGLLAAGLVVLSLGFGLAALPDDTEVLHIGLHVLIIAAALATVKYNKLSVDGLLLCKKSK